MTNAITIERTWKLNPNRDDWDHFGYNTITVHTLYLSRVRARPDHSADHHRMSWAHTAEIFFNLGREEFYWKNKSFAERWAMIHQQKRRWFPQVWPRPKVHVYEYSAIATCDGELNTFLDWEDFEEMLSYEVYVPVKPKTSKKKARGE